MLSLAFVLAEVATLIEAERARPTQAATLARRRVEKRAREVRGRLAGRIGKAVLAQFTAALIADGGLALRAAVAAAPDIRPHAVRGVVDGAAMAREHAITSTSGLVLLARASRWSALSNALLDGALRTPSGETLKLASLCGQQARLDALAALTLAKRSQDAPPLVDEGEERLRRYRQEQERKREALAAQPDGPEEESGA